MVNTYIKMAFFAFPAETESDMLYIKTLGIQHMNRTACLFAYRYAYIRLTTEAKWLVFTNLYHLSIRYLDL